ncbi:substrate-binding domain-containing protein, partial [Petrachloros mirabilis]
SPQPKHRTNSICVFLAFLIILSALSFVPGITKAEVSGSLKIAGNGPELPTIEALARAFEKANPRAYVDILWDDKSKPIELVKDGEAQIAVTGSEEPSLKATQVAWDGIGILVHLSNLTKVLSKQQVADLFSGKVKEWSELGGSGTRILLIDRPKNQNIREAFERQLGIVGKIPEGAKVIAKDEKVVKTVVGTLPPLSAVAYISLSQGLSVVADGVAVRLVPVDQVEPEVPTVKDGRYPLRRPILFLSQPQGSPLVETFSQFALSPDGQKILSETYVPLERK